MSNIHAHLQKKTELLTLTSLTNPKLQLLSHAIHLFFVLQSKYYLAEVNFVKKKNLKMEKWEVCLERLHLLNCGLGHKLPNVKLLVKPFPFPNSGFVVKNNIREESTQVSHWSSSKSKKSQINYKKIPNYNIFFDWQKKQIKHILWARKHNQNQNISDQLDRYSTRSVTSQNYQMGNVKMREQSHLNCNQMHTGENRQC